MQFLAVERRHASQSEARDRLTTTEETRLGPNQPEFLPVSFLSKLVERVVTARFISHAEENKLFPDRQSSYRRGHSTETVVTMCPST